MTKEQDFKRRFTVLLEDLHASGTKDAQAMWLLGRLTTSLTEEAKQKTWSNFKAVLSGPAYDAILKVFQAQGNELLQQGKVKEAYAMQVLGFSLVARTQKNDPDLAEGDKLLDQLIDRSVAYYRDKTPAH